MRVISIRSQHLLGNELTGIDLCIIPLISLCSKHSQSGSYLLITDQCQNIARCPLKHSTAYETYLLSSFHCCLNSRLGQIGLFPIRRKNRTPYLQLHFLSKLSAIVILSSRNIPSMQHYVLLFYGIRANLKRARRECGKISKT